MEAFQIRSRSAYHMKACDVTCQGLGLAWGILASHRCPAEDSRSRASFTETAFLFCTTTVETRQPARRDHKMSHNLERMGHKALHLAKLKPG